MKRALLSAIAKVSLVAWITVLFRFPLVGIGVFCASCAVCGIALVVVAFREERRDRRAEDARLPRATARERAS